MGFWSLDAIARLVQGFSRAYLRHLFISGRFSVRSCSASTTSGTTKGSCWTSGGRYGKMHGLRCTGPGQSLIAVQRPIRRLDNDFRIRNHLDLDERGRQTRDIT